MKLETEGGQLIVIYDNGERRNANAVEQYLWNLIKKYHKLFDAIDNEIVISGEIADIMTGIERMRDETQMC